MSCFVFDACAIIAHIYDEVGGDEVGRILNEPDAMCTIHAVNAIEVCYDLLRRWDPIAARQALLDFERRGLTIREDLDSTFWQEVGQLKSRGRISLADCFCITLAQRLGGTVVTTDHHEFDRLVPLGLCPIHFIR